MANKSELLQRRLVVFGASACELSRRLPRDAAGQNLTRQLVRSATSPAANYAEAREAESTTDYVHKMKICLKELRETSVWIGMAKHLSHGTLNADALDRECNELIAIFVACLKKARSHAPPPVPRPLPLLSLLKATRFPLLVTRSSQFELSQLRGA